MQDRDLLPLPFLSASCLFFYNREDEEMKNSWAKTASSKRIDKKQHPAEKIRIDKKQHPAEKILEACH